MGGQAYKSLLDNMESEPGTDVEAYESLQNIIESRRLKEQHWPHIFPVLSSPYSFQLHLDVDFHLSPISIIQRIENVK